MPTYVTIDPSKKLSRPHAKLLHAFLTKAEDRCQWTQGTPYSYTDPATKTDYQITFTHNLFRRELATPDEGLPYRIEGLRRQDGCLGTTQKSKVYPLMPGVIVPGATATFFKPKPFDKHRVVKVVNLLSIKKQREQQIIALTREIKMANEVGQLSVKPLLQVGDFAFITMKRAPGLPLSAIINSQRLSNSERYQLSYSLLYFANKLLAEKKIIHLDLKPDNIIVDMRQVPYKITFIDFENAAFFGEFPHDPRGTPAYACPGRYQNDISAFQDNRLDVFSLGKILFEIWSKVDNKYYCDMTNFTSVDRELLQLDRLFEGIDKPEAGTIQLQALLAVMLQLPYSYRFTLQDSIEVLERDEVKAAFAVDSDVKRQVFARVSEWLNPSHLDYEIDEHKRHALTKLQDLISLDNPLVAATPAIKAYRWWACQPCLMQRRDKTIVTNGEVMMGEHKNFFIKLFSSQATTDGLLTQIILDPCKVHWLETLGRAIEGLTVESKPTELIDIQRHLTAFRSPMATGMTTEFIDTTINAVVTLAGEIINKLDDEDIPSNEKPVVEPQIEALYRAMLEFDDQYCTDALDALIENRDASRCATARF